MLILVIALVVTVAGAAGVGDTSSPATEPATTGSHSDQGENAEPRGDGGNIITEQDIRDIGIPVRSVNWTRLLVAKGGDGNECIYATMGQQGAGLIILRIDPVTGQCRQYTAEDPKANYPTAACLSRTGRLYIGATYSGHLLCYDPVADALTDLGPINEKSGGVFVCNIREDEQGRLWIGCYPDATLTCYDPATGKFTRYGRMDDVDMYCYPWVNSDGTIASLIRMTRPHIVVFDPKTKQKSTVGPTVTTGEGTLWLRRLSDDKLYITSTKGNFRLEGDQAVPVEELPPPAPAPVPTLSDGSTLAFSDPEFFREIEIKAADGSTRRLRYDFEAAGSDIFYLHAGPDGCVYGSSALPLHLFRYNPKTDDLADLGLCTTTQGEAYSMGNLDGKLYIASYSGARLSVYDPARPYHFGETPEDNPRDLGEMDEISLRPRSMLTGPLGRVWTASLPNYGVWGGPLSWYDPVTEKRGSYRVFGDRSAYTLAHLPEQELIAVGTTIAGGSGAKPKETRAVLVLWDYKAEAKVWEGTLDRPVNEFKSLLLGPDGRLYGIAGVRNEPAEIFVFDPERREFVDHRTLPPGSVPDHSLQNGPDGAIYGFTWSSLFRMDPKTLDIEILIESKDAFRFPGPIIGEYIYFGTGVRLRAIKLF